ncbi:MAG: polysaccharide deacetylase family protein [Bacteroidia bacterium]|nr:polysaccharide deacetylase family protein [Bacteroidia bacterium]
MAKVLMLHRVLPEKLITQPNAYTTFGTLISSEYFETVLSLLKNENFEFVTISEIASRNKKNKLVALTFDDGYSDNFEFALPILQKYNATATFFPVVEPCKNNSVLPLDIYYQCIDEMNLNEEQRFDFIKGETKRKFYLAEPKEQMKLLKELFAKLPKQNRVNYMSTEQLRQLAENGFEIGSHGMTHSLLTADYMNEEKVLTELQQSKKWIERVIGKNVLAYCFPSGEYNFRMTELVKQVGYTSTCLVFKKENEKEALPSYDRIFVKPNSLDELQNALNVE